MFAEVAAQLGLLAGRAAHDVISDHLALGSMATSGVQRFEEAITEAEFDINIRPFEYEPVAEDHEVQNLRESSSSEASAITGNSSSVWRAIPVGLTSGQAGRPADGPGMCVKLAGPHTKIRNMIAPKFSAELVPFSAEVTELVLQKRQS